MSDRHFWFMSQESILVGHQQLFYQEMRTSDVSPVAFTLKPGRLRLRRVSPSCQESVSQSCHLEESCLVCLFCCRVNTRHPRLGVTLEAARHNKWRPPLRTTFSRSIKAAWNSSSRRIGSSTAEAAVKRTLSSGQLMFRNKRSHIQTRVSLKIQSE